MSQLFKFSQVFIQTFPDSSLCVPLLDIVTHVVSRCLLPHVEQADHASSFPLLLTRVKSARQPIWFRVVLNLRWEHLVISCWSWKDLAQTESLSENRAQMQLVIAHPFVSGNKTNVIYVDISKLAAWWFDSLCSLSILCSLFWEWFLSSEYLSTSDRLRRYDI